MNVDVCADVVSQSYVRIVFGDFTRELGGRVGTKRLLEHIAVRSPEIEKNINSFSTFLSGVSGVRSRKVGPFAMDIWTDNPKVIELVIMKARENEKFVNVIEPSDYDGFELED